MKYLEKIVALLLLGILFLSCTQERPVESVESLIGKRVQIKVRKDLGENISEIISTLKRLKTYSDLIAYCPKEDYKSNLKIRKLDFDSYQIFETFWTKKRYSVRVNYVIHHDSIVYGSIESIDRKEEYNLIEDSVFHKDENLIKDYVDKHNKKYKTSKTAKDFMNEMKDVRSVWIACGYAAKGYGEIERVMLRELNIDFIRIMLTSFNPEDQARGIIGMMKLQESDLPMNQNDLLIEKMLKERDSKIYCCRGCTVDFVSLSRYLDSYDWKQIPNIDLNQ